MIRVVDFLAHRYVRNESKQYFFQGFRTTFSEVLYYIPDAIFVYPFPFRLIGFWVASRRLRSTHCQHACCLFLYLYIYLPVYGFTTFVKYDDTSHARSEEVNTNDARRDFHARSSLLFWFQTLQNLLILLTSYAS